VVYQQGLVEHIGFLEQCASIYYRQPRNILLMPIVRKIRLSDNMRTNLRGKIRELFLCLLFHTCNEVFLQISYSEPIYSYNMKYKHLIMNKGILIIQLYYCLWGIFPSVTALACLFFHRRELAGDQRHGGRLLRMNKGGG
jgi:hypothetical protein